MLGQQIGHIKVVDVLGEGGMGAVYAGFDATLQRAVALKAIRSDFRLNPDAKARFLREARILSNLHHLNEMGKPIIIRVPLIPGRTDSDQNIQRTIDLLSRLKSVERVDIMAYREYGNIKYEQLGKEYTVVAKPYPDEYLENIKKLFEQTGLNVQLGG